MLVASSFGLLHGFGFASVLAETGLPDTERLKALLAFNVGVELGQLAFVGAMVLLFSVVRLRVEGVARVGLAQRSAAYAVGILATFWMYERLQGFVP